MNGSVNEIEELPAKSSSGVPVGEDNEEKKLKASSSRVWNNVSEAEEVEAPPSPSNSGYDGGRRSSATSGIEDANEVIDDENVQVRSRGDSVGASDSQVPPWTPGKRHGDEVSVFFKRQFPKKFHF